MMDETFLPSLLLELDVVLGTGIIILIMLLWKHFLIY